MSFMNSRLQTIKDTFDLVSSNMEKLLSMPLDKTLVFSFRYASDPNNSNDVIGRVHNIKGPNIKIKIIGYRKFDVKISEVLRSLPNPKKRTIFNRRDNIARYLLNLGYVTDIKVFEENNIPLYVNFAFLSPELKKLFTVPKNQ